MIKAITSDGQDIYQDICKEAFEKLNLSGEAIVDISFVDEDEIKSINNETRGIDKVTDVLSFPMIDKLMAFEKNNYMYDYDEELGGVVIGSIVICKERAKEQAEEFGHSIERENGYLFTHGLLHLLGYDHMEEDEKKIMREAEENILSSLNITR